MRINWETLTARTLKSTINKLWLRNLPNSFLGISTSCRRNRLMTALVLLPIISVTWMDGLTQYLSPNITKILFYIYRSLNQILHCFLFFNFISSVIILKKLFISCTCPKLFSPADNMQPCGRMVSSDFFVPQKLRSAQTSQQASTLLYFSLRAIHLMNQKTKKCYHHFVSSNFQ